MCWALCEKSKVSKQMASHFYDAKMCTNGVGGFLLWIMLGFVEKTGNRGGCLAMLSL